MGKFGFYVKPDDVTVDFVKNFAKTTWCDLIKLINQALSDNKNPLFLVGNNLTIADCLMGGFILKFAFGFHPHKSIYMAEVEKSGRVHKWAMQTVIGIFGHWHVTQPKPMAPC